MTRQFFEKEGFLTIPVGTREAAKAILEFNINSLDAVILDVRLTYEDKPEDVSGYELALETLDRFPNDAPPIVMYSLYTDELHERDGIIFVSKKERRKVLMEKVMEQINLRRTARRPAPRPSHANPPVIVLSGQPDGAERLLAELKRHEVEALPCPGVTAALEVAPHLPSPVFVIDLDACGPGVGLEAIRLLKMTQEAVGHPFYVAALGEREDSRREAAQAGADVFLVKDSAETDALELITRIAQHKIQIERAAATKTQTQLAVRWYEELVRQLRELRKSPARGMGAAAETVQRALNWPFLMPQEQHVLTALYMQMLAAGGRAADPRTIDLCVEGASMLADDRAKGADVKAWSERARRHSPDFTLAWLDEEYFDDDPEEDD
ncbi:MAG TPA: hypothetical protein VF659_14580 [Pyrinomonadaceae bacterium]